MSRVTIARTRCAFLFNRRIANPHVHVWNDGLIACITVKDEDEALATAATERALIVTSRFLAEFPFPVDKPSVSC